MTEPAPHRRTDDQHYLRRTQAFFAERAASWDVKYGDDMPAYAAAVAAAALPAGPGDAHRSRPGQSCRAESSMDGSGLGERNFEPVGGGSSGPEEPPLITAIRRHRI
ncbi:hypothetical protein [Catellatospora sp. IY07-71]|uniref:hypothetical protein n=1 Tax=Catellatospora sp. IY07-71 TaxID=2728827 RepID=UPI001BB347DC|nr:hypothetical protein [Catellatospora sp. IY07-71]